MLLIVSGVVRSDVSTDTRTELNSKTLIRYALKATAFGFIVMGVVLFFTISPETGENVKKFPLRLIPLILLLVAGSWFCSGARLWVLCKSMGYKMTLVQALVAGLAAEFGVASTPGGVGGTVIRLVFMKKAKVPLTCGASILTADAVLDVSFFVILIPFALMIMGGDSSWNVVMEELRKVPIGVMIGVMALLVLAAVLLFRKGGRWARWLEDRLEHVQAARKRRLASRLRYARWKTRNALVRVLTTTRFMFQKHVLALVVAFVFTAFQWLCRYGILPVILLAFTGSVSFLPLLVMQGLFLVLSFMLLLPGGGGVIELITTLVLGQFVPTSTVGIVLIIWRFFTYYLYLLAGGAVFFMTWGNLDRVFPPDRNLVEDRN